MSGVSSLHFLRLIEGEGDICLWSDVLSCHDKISKVGTQRLLELGSGERVSGLNLLEFVHREDRTLYEEAVAALRRGQSVEVLFRLMRSDGSLRWVNYRAELLLGRNGKPEAVIGIVRDVTKQKATQDALSHSWVRSQTLIGLIGGVQWGLSGNGDLLFRQAWFNMTGQNVRESNAWGWIAIIHPRDRHAIKDKCIRALMENSPLDFEARLLISGSPSKTFTFKAAPILESSGPELVGIVTESQFGENMVLPTEVHLLDARTIAAARTLLRWTHEDLAKAAGVSVSSVRRGEDDAKLSLRTKQSILATLLSHGVCFWKHRGSISVGLPMPHNTIAPSREDLGTSQ